MIFGFPWSVPWGDHEDFIKSVVVTSLNGALKTTFIPITGYGQYWQPLFDGIEQGPPVYGGDSAYTTVTGYPNPLYSAHIVSICPLGDWAISNYDVTPQQLYWEAARADRLRITVVAAPDFFSFGDSGQLTSWSLTGVSRFINCAPYPRRPTWGTWDLTLSTSGNHTVSGKLNGVTMFSGSIAGNGVVTLTAANGSGISGTVTLTYSADFSSGAKVVARYPASYPLHWKTTPFAAPDFPRTQDGFVNDDGHGNTFIARSGPLAANTYYVVAHQKDDDGNESTNTDGGGVAAVVVGAPATPGTPEINSAGPPLVIQWTASTTTNATYNIYDSTNTGALDMSTVSTTHIAGTGTLTQSMSAVVGFTGTRYIIVRAVSIAGVEEGNTQILAVAYVAGVAQLPTPPTPGVGTTISISGRTITVPVFVNTSGQAVAASSIKIWLQTSTAINFAAAADATVSINAAVNTTINTNISATAAGNGNYYFAVRTYTAGGVSSGNVDQYGPFKLTTTAPSGPTSTSVEVGY